MLRVDSFSTAPVDCARLNELFQQDISLVPHLIKMWEENRCRAVLCETERGPLAGAALAREFSRLGSTHVLAHGTHDATGQMTSFFVFACRPGAVGPKQSYLADLLVPYLHAAWVRSQVTWPLDHAGANKPAKAGFLTPRETQILQWIYHGKSNIEIGMILDISPLTVKNHVQKTLRKLNVMNRTQAVGKALAAARQPLTATTGIASSGPRSARARSSQWPPFRNKVGSGTHLFPRISAPTTPSPSSVPARTCWIASALTSSGTPRLPPAGSVDRRKSPPTRVGAGSLPLRKSKSMCNLRGINSAV